MIERCYADTLKYIVTNKDRIVLVTHNLRSAEALEKELSSKDYPKDFCLHVVDPKVNK